MIRAALFLAVWGLGFTLGPLNAGGLVLTAAPGLSLALWGLSSMARDTLAPGPFQNSRKETTK